MSWIHRILGKDGSTQVAADPTHSALRVTVRPLEVSTLGAFSKAHNSAIMAAGLAANANIYSFRNGGSNLALVRKVTITMAGLATAFTAGQATFNMFAARSFTASDSGGTAGTLSGNNAKLRSSFGTMTISDIRGSATAALTAGTRTLDTDPMASITTAIGVAVSTIYIPPSTELWAPEVGQYPLMLAQNEGFVIQATVPATGTWVFSVRTTWDETPVGTY
jgi:hypothetical protein